MKEKEAIAYGLIALIVVLVLVDVFLGYKVTVTHYGAIGGVIGAILQLYQTEIQLQDNDQTKSTDESDEDKGVK